MVSCAQETNEGFPSWVVGVEIEILHGKIILLWNVTKVSILEWIL
jgi:hypothetical protein